jgi:hypothetical protein
MKYHSSRQNGTGKDTYLFEANADEWNLIATANRFLKYRTPKILETSPLHARLKNIIKEILNNVPRSHARQLYDTTVSWIWDISKGKASAEKFPSKTSEEI